MGCSARASWTVVRHHVNVGRVLVHRRVVALDLDIELARRARLGVLDYYLIISRLFANFYIIKIWGLNRPILGKRLQFQISLCERGIT